MKKGFIIPIIILAILVISAAVASWKIYFEKKLKPAEDIEISQLKEQVKLLKEDRDASKPSPSPTPPPVELFAVLDKSKITPATFYTLTCWHIDSIPDNPITKSFKSKLEEREILMHVCQNNSLNKIIFISASNGAYLKIFDIKSQETKLISNITSGGGVCGINITLWSKENDVYYEFLGCDSPPEKSPFQHMGRIHADNI